MIFHNDEMKEIVEDVNVMMAIGSVDASPSASSETKRQQGNCPADDGESHLRTYVFPFCWPETLSEHQKRFELFSKFLNDEQILQMDWHLKVILIIAKPIDSVLSYVNWQILTLNSRNNLPLKKILFDEKELFWKLAYVKLGRRILGTEIERIRKKANQNSVAKFQMKTQNSNENDHSTDIKLFNAMDQELQHIRREIIKILRKYIKNSNDISFILQMIDGL